MTRAERYTPGFCDLAMSLCPPAVLCKAPAQRVSLASERQARGRGSPRQPWTTLAAEGGSKSGCPITAQGSGSCDRYAPGRSRAHGMQPCRARLAGSSRGGPVRRQAHPLPSLSVGRTAPDRTPPGVCACHRPPGPTSGPARSRRCRCPVCSPPGRGLSALAPGRAGTRPRPQKRPL